MVKLVALLDPVHYLSAPSVTVRLRGLRATLRGLASTLIAALGLAATSLLSLSHFGGAPPGTVYVPAHLDAAGKLVPGAFVPKAAP